MLSGPRLHQRCRTDAAACTAEGTVTVTHWLGTHGPSDHRDRRSALRAPRNTMSIFASDPTVRDSRMTAVPTRKTGTSQTAALMTRRSLRIAGWATTALHVALAADRIPVVHHRRVCSLPVALSFGKCKKPSSSGRSGTSLTAPSKPRSVPESLQVAGEPFVDILIYPTKLACFANRGLKCLGSKFAYRRGRTGWLHTAAR